MLDPNKFDVMSQHLYVHHMFVNGGQVMGKASLVLLREEIGFYFSIARNGDKMHVEFEERDIGRTCDRNVPTLAARN
jgi:hypothetical protein